jgi:hypothetical protein
MDHRCLLKTDYYFFADEVGGGALSGRGLVGRHSTIMSEVEAALCISVEDVLEARQRIREHVHLTPCMQCTHLDNLAGLELFFKCELFQKAGSFKVNLCTWYRYCSVLSHARLLYMLCSSLPSLQAEG